MIIRSHTIPAIPAIPRAAIVRSMISQTSKHNPINVTMPAMPRLPRTLPPSLLPVLVGLTDMVLVILPAVAVAMGLCLLALELVVLLPPIHLIRLLARTPMPTCLSLDTTIRSAGRPPLLRITTLIYRTHLRRNRRQTARSSRRCRKIVRPHRTAHARTSFQTSKIPGIVDRLSGGIQAGICIIARWISACALACAVVCFTWQDVGRVKCVSNEGP